MRGELQLLPLINIVFLLLIFFMLAGVVSVPDDAAATPPTAACTSRARRWRGPVTCPPRCAPISPAGRRPKSASAPTRTPTRCA